MGTTPSTQESCVLTTPKGSLRGVEIFHSDTRRSVYRRFTRIPYALPPVKDRRFRRPVPVPATFSFDHGNEPGDYTSFGPICPQPVYEHNQVQLENPHAAPPIPLVESEDCLYLNLWVPGGGAPPRGWPVQFFIRMPLCVFADLC